MSKTFKLSGIMLFSVMGLQLSRILSSLLPLSDNIGGWLFSFIMQCLFLGLFPFLLYKIMFRDGDFLLDIKIKKSVNPLSYLLAIVIGVLTYCVNLGASTVWYIVLNLLGFTYTVGGGVLFTSPEVLIFEVLTGCLLPGIFEEITDRGILLATLDGVKSDKIKVIAVGLFFGACHQNIPQLGPTALAGVIIGYMAIKSGSIVPGMIVHFMNNFFITIGSYLSQKGISLGILTVLDNLLFSNSIMVIGVAAANGIALIYILRLYAKINKDYNEKALKKSQTDTINDIYGFYNQDACGMPIYYASEKNSAGNKLTKVRLRDYSLLIIAFISAMAVTVFTFIWGLLR